MKNASTVGMVVVVALASGCGGSGSLDSAPDGGNLQTEIDTLTGSVAVLTTQVAAIQAKLPSDSEGLGLVVTGVQTMVADLQTTVGTLTQQLAAVTADVATLKAQKTTTLQPHLLDGAGNDLGLVVGRSLAVLPIGQKSYVVDYQTDRYVLFDQLNCQGNAYASPMELLAGQNATVVPVVTEAISAAGHYFVFSGLVQQNMMFWSQYGSSNGAAPACHNQVQQSDSTSAYPLTDLGPGAPTVDASKLQIVMK